MAAPHVAGVAALLYGANPKITPDEVAAVLKRTAQPFPSAATDPCNTSTCGAGILDAGAAVLDVTKGSSAAGHTASSTATPQSAPAK